jgi:hypothetical protein
MHKASGDTLEEPLLRLIMSMLCWSAEQRYSAEKARASISMIDI